MKVLIAGDYCPQNRVADLFEKRDFESVLGNVRDVISTVDYSIVNFECPVCDGTENPIEKYGPNLRCTERGVEALKWVGFNCVTLANNHFLDYGEGGVEKTINTFSKYGIDYVGGGINLADASKILYKEIKGKTLAIINCCEHEFSIATETTAGSNPLNPIHQYYAIQEARKKSNYVLVIVHGGHEHFQLPSLRMQETYRFFIDSGADAVINHHQHCYGGYELYSGKPIFYGLGNFCFENIANADKSWHEGYMVELTFEDYDIHYRIYFYDQCSDKPILSLLHSEHHDREINALNEIISDKAKLKYAIESYYDKSIESISSLFEPIQNRFVLGAQKRGWLPSFVKRKILNRFKNYYLCESYREKINYFFENK